jgi:outer membrane protein
MRKILLIAILMVIAFGLYAQNVKVAYINTEEIMSKSSLFRGAQTQFNLAREEWVKQIQDIEADIDRIERQLNTGLMILESGKREAEENRRNLIRERQQMIERIFGDNGLAEQENARLMGPILERLFEVLKKIGEDENYTMIFDSSSSGLLWAEPRLNITNQVIAEMDRLGGGR